METRASGKRRRPVLFKLAHHEHFLGGYANMKTGPRCWRLLLFKVSTIFGGIDG